MSPSTSRFSKVFAASLFLLNFFGLRAQDCTYYLSGKVRDTHTNEAIAFANIYVVELERGAVTDEKGNYLISGLCSGSYHVNISHVGCDAKKLYLTLDSDTSLPIDMDHNRKLLSTVEISADSEILSSAVSSSLSAREIQLLAGKNISDMLATLDGVQALRTGIGVSKPVVQGLYGNRLTLINNGITQRGQQWGNDHSPEIDPLLANKITVIKGVGAVQYQGSSLGAIILVEPQSIGLDPHIHGRAQTFFQSNGLGGGLHVEAEQYSKVLAWKVSGTLRKTGEFKTPHYLLRNTGLEEANFALQLEKSWFNILSTDFYFSAFNTRIGILRGSQIGNLTDLREALQRPVPFYTEAALSYDISAPKQEVGHQLLKIHNTYQIGAKATLQLTYALQRDRRKEFDVRRGGRTEDPALSLEQINNFAELIYAYATDNFELKSGAQLNHASNKNIPETGILPLIPNYSSSETGVFLASKWQEDRWLYEAGARFDIVLQDVVAISKDLPRRIQRYSNDFENYTIAGGLTWTPVEPFSGSVNLGITTRNPAINELYSNGLHQGVSGIELGDEQLQKEQAIKTSLKLNYHKDFVFSLSVQPYLQYVSEYIYLQPQDSFRLTIRGAFPLFAYEQTDAAIYGADLSGTWHFAKRWTAATQVSLIDGLDLSASRSLVYIPANSLRASLSYSVPRLGKWENMEFSIQNSYVFKKTGILPDQDFAQTPEGYNLTDLRCAISRQLKQNQITFFAAVDNVFNIAYRDYLNRQRYFSDDIGINIRLSLNYEF